MVCRSKERGEAALTEIREVTGNQVSWLISRALVCMSKGPGSIPCTVPYSGHHI